VLTTVTPLEQAAPARPTPAAHPVRAATRVPLVAAQPRADQLSLIGEPLAPRSSRAGWDGKVVRDGPIHAARPGLKPRRWDPPYDSPRLFAMRHDAARESAHLGEPKFRGQETRPSRTGASNQAQGRAAVRAGKYSGQADGGRPVLLPADRILKDRVSRHLRPTSDLSGEAQLRSGDDISTAADMVNAIEDRSSRGTLPRRTRTIESREALLAVADMR